MIELILTNEEAQVIMGLLNGANIPSQVVDDFVSLRNKVKEASKDMPRQATNGTQTYAGVAKE